MSTPGTRMTALPSDSPRPDSARPETTARIMAQTGLDEQVLTRLVHRFYGRIRRDPVLGPIFESRIADWDPHLRRMLDFWSSVALLTGRYHGAPVPAHAALPVAWPEFQRWLALFRQTAEETCTPAGAAHLMDRAQRIARSLHMSIEDARPQAVPRLS